MAMQGDCTVVVAAARKPFNNFKTVGWAQGAAYPVANACNSPAIHLGSRAACENFSTMAGGVAHQD
jgi:hypothetical protein